MDYIILIKGKVKYQITLDPTVWIFDHRKRELKDILEGKTSFSENDESETEFIKKTSLQWDRAILQGANQPTGIKDEAGQKEDKELTGNYCMPLKPFLENAEPEEDAKQLVIETREGDVTIPLETGKELILNFAQNGKMLKEDGPVHIYFPDGSNLSNPIKYVKAFRVE